MVVSRSTTETYSHASAPEGSEAARDFLEVCERLEFFVARIDLRPGKCAEALHAELLATKAAHNRAVDDRAGKVLPIDMLALKVESAGCQRACATALEICQVV